MIRCLFAQISRNQSGQPIRKELLITGDILQIGRAAGCKVLLLDHRVNLYHAVIRRSNDGKLYVERSEGANLYVNGSFALSAKLKPGTHVQVGPYELIVEPPLGDYDLVLSAEIVNPSTDDDHAHIAAVKQAPVSLAEAGLSKRKPTFWLVGAIALVFLLLPMVPPLDSTLPKWVTSLHGSLIASWQVGEMSHGHQLIGAKCNVCHQHRFGPVPDKACESCHKAVGRHIGDKALHESVFKNLRCGKCHHEHRGENGEAIPDTLCTQCHANIKKKNAKTKLVNIRDFGSDHPAFNLTFKTGRKDQDVIKISQDEKSKLIEKPGLKFSHKVHLDKEGVASPEGDTVLSCNDCHQAGIADDQFKPITMKKSCQQFGCHALDFKPPLLERQLPHGSERMAMTALRDYYSTATIGKLAAGEKLLCVEGAGSGKNRLERALACANSRAMENATILFSPDHGCGECHEIIRDADDKDVPWKVAPVTITNHWFRNSHFPHAKHNTAKCTECHDKTLSQKSSDVAIPTVEKCRECHSGNKQVKNKISSTCDSCHSFHNETAHQPSPAVQ